MDSLDMAIEVTKTCPFCRKLTTVRNIDADAYVAYLKGEGHIQKLLPALTPDEREILKTGICATCWDATFREESE